MLNAEEGPPATGTAAPAVGLAGAETRMERVGPSGSIGETPAAAVVAGEAGGRGVPPSTGIGGGQTPTRGGERVVLVGGGRKGVVQAAVVHSPIRADALASGTVGSSSVRSSSIADGAAASLRAAEDTAFRDSNATADGGLERLRLETLAEAAAGGFRQQRDRTSALRLLSAWRRAAATERSKREALSRLARGARRRRLRGGLGRWRAGARAVQAKEERRAAREGAAAAATAKEAVAEAAKANAAAAAAARGKAAAEKLAAERETELRLEKATGQELREAVERLQTEVRVGVDGVALVYGTTGHRGKQGVCELFTLPACQFARACVVDDFLLTTSSLKIVFNQHSTTRVHGRFARPPTGVPGSRNTL